MSVIIASILGFLTGGVMTFLLLKLQTRKPAETPVPPTSSTPPAVPPVPQPTPTAPPVTPAPVPDAPPAPVPVPAVADTPAPVEPSITPLPVVEASPDPTRHYQNPDLNPDIELHSYRIMSWGQSGKASYTTQLIGYAQHPNYQIRKAVAIALGNIAATGSLRSDEARAILTLGKLSRDPVSPVRESAIAALGQVKSGQVIPLLQQALRDTDADVVRLASAALSRFKYYPARPPAKPASTPKKR